MIDRQSIRLQQAVEIPCPRRAWAWHHAKFLIQRIHHMHAAAAAVEDVAAAWDTAARVGLRDRHLSEAATRCLAIVEPFVPAALADSFDRLSASVRGGRCPGEEFAENAVAKGIEPAVLEALG